MFSCVVMMAASSSSLKPLSRGASIWVLFLLASLHLSAELGHFLIGVVSKYVARDIHYGTQGCFANSVGNGNVTATCVAAKSRLACENITITADHTEFQKSCHWDWTGLGGEYQFLAGPSFMAIFTVASILWGMLADKFDRVNILFSASILYSLAMIFTSVSTKFWHLVILRMLLAAGVAGIAPIAPGIIFDMFAQNERALAMGFFHWGIYLGNGLTFVVGKYITEMNLFNAGWRSTFVVSGMPGALLAILVMFTIEDPPRSKSKKLSAHAHVHSTTTTVGEDETEGVEGEGEAEVEDCCDIIDEAEVLISSSGAENENQNVEVSVKGQGEGPMARTRKDKRSSSCFLQPVVYLLGLGACLRHSAGYTWGYNSALYFQQYYPSYEGSSIWLSWITIVGGSLGVILGGYVSDRLVSKMGIASRALVLAVSQIMAAPFALGLLYLSPPWAFMSLFVGYLFAEMWYGVVFAILVELLPTSFRSLGLAISLFVVNNIGGNLPIIVTPLTSMFGFRGALTILYPGALFASSILFFMTYIALLRK